MSKIKIHDEVSTILITKFYKKKGFLGYQAIAMIVLNIDLLAVLSFID